jgi:cell wall-associated NlpC family hydrolase/murein DD-endopeptidase MepM/ murein hydrolase activator NlpD
MAFSSRLRARKPVSGLLVLGGALVLAGGVRADVYHPVANGDTLASVAARYRVSTQALRSANGLSNSDSTPLSAMLLRVPGAEGEQTPLDAPQSAPRAIAVTSAPRFASRGGGSLSRAVYETARHGDTWESIAARFRAAGNDVTVQSLRRRNGEADAPIAGQTVVVPLGQLNYQSPPVYAPRVATNAPVGRASVEPRNLGGGVYASGEFNLERPATQATTPAPRSFLVQSPSGGAVAPPRRGELASRGGYGQMARSAMGGEVRVLGAGEDAPAPRLLPGVEAATTTRQIKPSGSVARVGEVRGSGARIRRLPQASAQTLYKCAYGTRLAVLRQSGAWSAVLMSDHSTGWLPTRYMTLTEQTYDVSSQIVTSPGPGGAASYAGTRYAAQSPTVGQALRWLGTPYVYGGTTTRGIDCSSLVQHSFAACGMQLPRTAAQQARIGTAVEAANLQAGDRLYFSASGTRIDHTGLYMGDGLFVHASGSGRRVMVSNLFEPRNWNIYVGARR